MLPAMMKGSGGWGASDILCAGVMRDGRRRGERAWRLEGRGKGPRGEGEIKDIVTVAVDGLDVDAGDKASAVGCEEGGELG